jgi:hypothetical protein
LVGELQTEYFTLQQHILKIETENAKLIQQASSPKPPNPKQQDNHTDVVVDLDDISTKVLQAVTNSPDGALKESLFAHFSLSVGKGDFIFDRLVTHKFIDVGRVQMGVGAFYFATPKGREYLSRKDLL